MFSIESVYSSVIKTVKEIIDEVVAEGLSPGMTYYAWDSRGQETELPNSDLMGIVGWAYAENEGLPTIQIGILTSLVLDVNQFREVRILDKIRNRFVGPGGDYHTLPLYDVTSEQEYGLLQVSDFEIMPAGRSEIRSTRNVGLEFIRASGD